MFAAVSLQVNITPFPQAYVVTDETYTQIGELSWSCSCNGADCMDLIAQMKQTYTRAYFGKGAPTPASAQFVSKLSITLGTRDIPKGPFDTAEDYELETSSKGIFITAENTYGVSRALATLAFIIEEAPEEKWIPGRYSMQSIKVMDHPVYQYRATMFDTARHFLPVSSFKRQLEAMALVKFNVMHIHLIDSQSSAFAPESIPAADFQNAAYYTGGWYRLFKKDLEEIARFANALGIHIMLEFDMPGHATSWGAANPSIIANCPSRGNTSVNPINDLTYDYIESYARDMVEAVFTPLGKVPLIHLGGDEVDHGCWNDDAEIAAYMASNGIDTKTLWQQFHERAGKVIDKITAGAGIRFYWQESFENGNNMENAVVHSWYSSSATVNAAKKGLKTIRSQGWYLDVNQPGQSRYSFQDSWQDFYAISPIDGVDKKYISLVLGGGSCMWAEYVNDANVDEFVWGRNAAVAEVLWSSPASRAITDALKYRLNMVSCKLNDLGVAAGPFRPSAPCPGSKGARFE